MAEIMQIPAMARQALTDLRCGGLVPADAATVWLLSSGRDSERFPLTMAFRDSLHTFGKNPK